jgi:FlaA1/EpsC-like NDP-sugar epimerase
VTGAAGSVGTELQYALHARGDRVYVSDLVWGTEIRSDWLRGEVRCARPDVIFHLAGAKHAPHGELDPLETARINIEGTANVLEAAPEGCRVILASTCKAANPETAYGASKLIAERMVLNAGHSVARFYNVREASGNVFEIWAAMEPPLPATPCYRYFITMPQAIGLLLRVAELPPGRYTLDPGDSRLITDEAAQLVGRENVTLISPRRGDRVREPRLATGEWLESLGDGLERIYSHHDGRASADMGHSGADVLRAHPAVPRAA